MSKTTQDKLDLLTANQASKILGCSTTTVLRWVDDGRLTPVTRLRGKTGSYLFDAKTIEKLAADTETVVRRPKATA